MTTTIAYAIGSVSDDSLNRRLANALMKDAPADVEFIELPVKELPFIKPEYDNNFPPAATLLHEILKKADGVLLVTPEYNRSTPAALRNVFDWASRPHGTNLFGNKPVYIAGATPGATGTAVAQADLRQFAAYFGAHLLTRPELYISIGKNDFDAEGRATTPGTQKFLASSMSTFVDFIKASQA